MSKKLLGMVLASLFFVACSLSPEQAALVRSVELPDLVLTNATYVLDRGEDTPLTVVAGQIALYDQSHTGVVSDLTFSQKDAQGTLVLQGSADTATVDLQSYDAQLQGAVSVEKIDQNFLIEAEHLRWLHDSEMLVSEEQTEVTVTYEGNKRVRGIGLRADLATSIVTFEQVLEGVVLL